MFVLELVPCTLLVAVDAGVAWPYDGLEHVSKLSIQHELGRTKLFRWPFGLLECSNNWSEYGRIMQVCLYHIITFDATLFNNSLFQLSMRE